MSTAESRRNHELWETWLTTNRDPTNSELGYETVTWEQVSVPEHGGWGVFIPSGDTTNESYVSVKADALETLEDYR